MSQAAGKPEVVVRPPRSPSPSTSTAEEDKNLLKAPEGTENLWNLLPVRMMLMQNSNKVYLQVISISIEMVCLRLSYKLTKRDIASILTLQAPTPTRFVGKMWAVGRERRHSRDLGSRRSSINPPETIQEDQARVL